MNCERRNEARTEMVFDVMLCYEPFGILRGRTRNISFDGMFVETGPIRLPKNAEIQVVFNLPGATYAEPHHINARVVHSCHDGAGLAFINSKLSALKALHGAMNAA